MGRVHQTIIFVSLQKWVGALIFDGDESSEK